MKAFNSVGYRQDDDFILAGVVLDAGDQQFQAMKQLLDIGKKRYLMPDAEIENSEFNIASAGAICVLPKYNASLYDRYPFDILYSKNINVQYGLASVTKILTVVTGLPHIEALSERVTFVESDIQTGTGNIFNAGDVITINDMLFGLMFWSSNTCAQAFARHVGAKLLNDQSATPEQCKTAFIAEMNRIATDIGCANSEFDSPSGLSETNLSTVSDILRILIHASSFRALNDVWNKTTHTINIEGDDPRTETGTFSVTTKDFINTGYRVMGGKPGGMTTGQGVVFGGLAMIAKPKN